MHFYNFAVLRKKCSIKKNPGSCGTDGSGTSGYGIIKGAEKFGLSCKGLMSPEKNKINEIPLPAIFHINEHAEHYVVVYKVSKKFVFISDPAFGLRKIKMSDFFNWWSGVFFILFPTSDFEKGNEEKGLLFRFFTLLKPHKKIIFEVILASIMLSIFGVFTSFYFRFLIDEVLYSEIKSTLNLCSVCYLLVIIFQTVISFCRSEIILYLGTKIDVKKATMDTIFSIIKNKTTIMVAHRLSTIKNCDLIFIFNKGHLVEQGTYDQLLRKNGFYKKSWSAQNQNF